MRPGRLATLLAIVVSACNYSRNATLPSPVTATDSSLFAAVARSVADSAGHDVRIDPRPLNPEVNVTGPGVWANVPDSLFQRQAQILRHLGIRVGNADIPPNCTGTLLPDATGSDKAGCPKQRYVVAALGLPRTSSPYAPNNLASYRAVRVPEMTIGPLGFTVSSFDYIVTRSGGEWKLAARKPVMVTEWMMG